MLSRVRYNERFFKELRGIEFIGGSYNRTSTIVKNHFDEQKTLCLLRARGERVETLIREGFMGGVHPLYDLF